MREAIRCNQGGHPRASEGVRAHSDAIRCTQMHSDALRCTQMQSPLDRLLVHQLQLLQHTTGPLQPLTIDRLSTGLRRE